MIKQIEQSIEENALILPGQHVLIGVSGGADSVALLLMLKELTPKIGFKLTAAHLHHGIRGKDADSDLEFVHKLTRKLKIPFVSGKTNVPALARRKGISLEMAAREARYTFFAKQAKKCGADLAVTAHNADDQAETILLKLCRGAGARGLAGISHETALNGLRITRPMLDVTRAEVIAFLKNRKQLWREDRSNKDLSFLRNRVRHEILPLLQKNLNPKLKSALTRTADVLQAEDEWLDHLTNDLVTECEQPDGLMLGMFLCYPKAARRRVLLQWLVANGVPSDSISFDTIEQINALAAARRGTGTVTVSGAWVLNKEYGLLHIRPSTSSSPVPPFEQIIRIPGETIMADIGLRVITSRAPGIAKGKPRGPATFPAQASLSTKALGRKQLLLRSWRPGDRIRPLGMKGSKKLQDIFVDAKLPCIQRACVPIFECKGEIVWLPGYRIARGWEVKDPGEVAIQINVELV